MKKVLLFTAAVICMLMLASCSHEHSFGEWETVKAPTCTESGIEERSCDCGAKQSRNVVSLGHIEVADDAVAPTCTETGLTRGKHCSTCGYITVPQKTVDKTDHKFEQKAEDKFLKTAATCTEKAVYYESCSACGEKGSETFKYGNTVPHTFDKLDTDSKYLKSEATCTRKAEYYKSCNACGAKGTDTFESGDIKDHVFERLVNAEKYLVSDATCTKKAVYYKSCNCGEKGSETFEYGNTLPHTYTTYEKNSDATCTENATEISNCDVCSEPHTREVPNTALGHAEVNTENKCSACGEEAEYTKNMVYVAVSGGYQLVDKGDISDSYVIIPKYYNGLPVVSIGKEAFSDCTFIKRVTMPDSLKEIGDSAFLRCTNLESIEIPNGVEKIGGLAFAWCDKVKTVVVPDSVINIGMAAFGRCEGLENISVPFIGKNKDSSEDITYLIEELGYTFPWIFGIFSVKSSYDVPDDAYSLYSRVPFSSTGTRYYYYTYMPANLKAVKITNGGETQVDPFAFACINTITTIELPSSIKKISNSAFFSCDSLKKIILSDGLETIEKYAFEDCTALNTITLPSSLKKISAYAFYGCDALSSVTFEGTDGWNVNSSSIDVSTPSTNAVLLKKTYYNKEWTRS